MASLPKFNLIVAACENGGIGIKGQLPWTLKGDLKHFAKLTTETRIRGKSNAVIMGRKTWFCIPEKFRPLKNRVNVVVSQTMKDFHGAYQASSIEEALTSLTETKLAEQIETIWIIGGQSLYNHALNSPSLHRIYLTRILDRFECDAFFPLEKLKTFIRCNDPLVSSDVQDENGVHYQYEVYETAT